MPWRPAGSRSRNDPRGVAKVIRALRHLRDAAAAPDRAETERESASIAKRYHALKEEGIAVYRHQLSIF